jgi:hypothetical protein
MNYQLPFFDVIDTENLQVEYRTEIEFKGRMILIDLNFKAKSIDPSMLDAIGMQLNRIKEIDIDNRAELENETKDGFVVKDFIDDSMDMLEKEDLKDAMKNVDKTKPKKQQLFDAMYLNRMGFYPEEDEQCIISDYTYNEDLLDEVLVVTRKANGSFVSIQVES